MLSSGLVSEWKDKNQKSAAFRQKDVFHPCSKSSWRKQRRPKLLLRCFMTQICPSHTSHSSFQPQLRL